MDIIDLVEIHKSLLEPVKTDVMQKLNQLEKAINSIDDKLSFIKNNIDILSEIKIELDSLVKQNYLRPTRDRLYFKLLIQVQIVHDTNLITNIYQNFMKDIKLKADTCGVRMKYIEHLVCYHLWARLTCSPPDAQHIQRLINAKKDNDYSFPDKKLFIEIVFDDKSVPTILKIYDDDNIEIYEKTYDKLAKAYVEPVYCSSQVPKRKETTFASQKPWS